MFALGLYGLVALSCLAALSNWRLGLLLCVFIGIIQDPIRKVTLGTPAHLTIAFMPVYACAFFNLCSTTPLLRSFRQHHSSLLQAFVVIFICLLMSTAQTLSYGAEAFPVAMLGLFSYAGGLPSLFLGYHFIRDEYREIDKPLMIFAAMTAIMLIGVPLEYSGYQFSRPFLGTISMKGAWYRWYGANDYVAMISGFYRSPEIMGWHAAAATIIAIYLMLVAPRLGLLWCALGVWGLAGVFLSGRRKMFLVVLAFVAILTFLADGANRQRLIITLVIACAIIAPIVAVGVDNRYVAAAQSGVDTASMRLTQHTFASSVWLLDRIGLFGYGVGIQTQGAQHFGLSIQDRPLTEGGFEKIMVELGIAGTLAFLYLGVCLLQRILACWKGVRQARISSLPLLALVAFVAANMAAFVVAFQVYGDPLIVCLGGFTIGLLLSSARLAERRLLMVRQRSKAPGLSAEQAPVALRAI